METLLELAKYAGWTLLLLSVSLALSYAGTLILAKRRRSPIPPDGALLRIKSGADLYRAKFLGVLEDGWSFSPPVVAGVPVPLRPGDDLRVEAVLPQGVMVFSSRLVRRSVQPFCMVMEVPERASVLERREEVRIRDLEGLGILIEGRRSSLVDVSPGGFRVKAGNHLAKGDCVRIDVPWSPDPMIGYVLEVLPPGLRSDEAETRIRVQSEVDLKKIREFAVVL